MKTKTISFVIVFVLIFSMVPSTVLAAESDFEILYGVLTKYTGDDEIVTIPSSVSHIGKMAFKDNTKLREVVIPPSVISIGDSAFSGCTNLESVTLSEGLISIEDFAFKKCVKLKEIALPDTVTYLGNSAFDSCSGLRNIKLSNSLEFISDATFHQCANLTNIYIPDSVITIRPYSFMNCINLTSVTGMKSVTDIGESAFYSTPFVEGFSDGFLIVGDGILLKYGGKSSTVNIPQGVKIIYDKAFANNMNIENVIIPEGVTSIREQAFYNCKNLQNIKAPKTLKEVKSLAVAGTKWFKTQHGFLILGDVLVHYIDSQPNAVIPDGIKHIGFGAFSSSKITSVKIPESVESIDDFSFSRCENLSEIFIPGSVKSIGSNAFLGCYNLKKVVIEEGTTSLGNGIFNLCHSLESIKIPSTLTKATKKSFMGEPNGRFNIPSIIGDIILISYNASEEEVNLPEGIKTISGNAIENNLYLTNLIMPDSVTNVEQYAISDCNSLAAVIFGLVKEIKSHTIHNCPSLNIVFIPDTVTKIEPGAFYGSPLLNIVGYKGSYAEAYAEKNRVPFYTIEEFLEILNGTQTSPSL